jgi:hypothetical protein
VELPPADVLETRFCEESAACSVQAAE